MREFHEIKKTIIDFAAADKRVRAVLINGSRANPEVMPDAYQDYDITLLVSGMQHFTNNLNWTNVFGEKILHQLPDKMQLGDGGNRPKRDFHYLMLLEDGNRIDLTLLPVQRFKSHYRPESLTVVWLDKDGRFSDLGAPSDKDYHTGPPVEKQFLDHCNEFWWVSTGVAKGLARHEVMYAKELIELHLRPVLMKMTQWYVGSSHSFSVSIGKGGKGLTRLISPELQQAFLATYAGIDLSDNWDALLQMAALFGRLAQEVARRMDFSYLREEQDNASKYLKALRNAAR